MYRFVAATLAMIAVLSVGALVAADKPKPDEQTRTRQLGDSVRVMIEMAEVEPGCTEQLQQIYTMLRSLDTGKNGKIDPQAVKAQANRLLQERVKAAFDRLDTNKDGKISKDEARGLIKEHFGRIDTNKDGFIEYNELLQAAKERREHKAANAPATDTKPNAKDKE
jgi:Ca2+-binding EF-hand superfamily protein